MLDDIKKTLWAAADSSLENAWEEICVQVQSGEESFFWEGCTQPNASK